MVQFSPGVSWCGVVLSGFVVCWVCCCFVCVSCCLWCVLCVCLVFVFFCWFCFVLGCPLFCGPPGVGVLSVLVLVCFGWSAVLLVGCRGCVALSAFLLLVAPVRCTVLVLVHAFLLSWWFLVVVGLPPLFLVRHDLVRLWSCSWFNAECHPGWVAVWCFCSWWL